MHSNQLPQNGGSSVGIGVWRGDLAPIPPTDTSSLNRLARKGYNGQGQALSLRYVTPYVSHDPHVFTSDVL